jgi:hypothetical protein
MATVLSAETISAVGPDGKEIQVRTLTRIDDVTGKPADAKPVKFPAFTLDVTAETQAALSAFLADPASDDARRALGGIFARPRVGVSRTSAGSGNGADKRAWLRGHGYPDLGDRGKFTDEMNAAWEKFNAEPASA